MQDGTYVPLPVLQQNNADAMQADTQAKLSSARIPSTPMFTGTEPSLLHDNFPHQGDSATAQLKGMSITDALAHPDPKIQDLGRRASDEWMNANVPSYKMDLFKTVESPYEAGKRYLDTTYGYSALRNNETLLASHQSTWDKIANASMNLLGKTVAYVGQTVGFIGGAPVAALSGDISMMTDNFLTRAADWLKEGAQDNFPIYKGEKYQNGTIWQKLGTLDWWMDDAIDRVALTASMFVPGLGQVKGLGLAGAFIDEAGALKATGLLTSALKTAAANPVEYGVLGKMFNAKLMKVAATDGLVDFGVNPALKGYAQALSRAELYSWNVIGQSALNAKETQEAIKRRLEDDRKQGLNTLNDDEIKLKAAVGARNAFWETVPITLAGSMVEIPQMFSTASLAKSTLNKIFNPATGAELVAPAASRLSSFMRNSARALATGFEHGQNESMQVAISRYNEDAQAGKDVRGTIPGIWGDFLDNVNDPNGQNNIALGTIQGILMSAGGRIYKSAKNIKAREEADKQHVLNIINQARLERRYFVNDWTSRDENGEIQVDKNGEVKPDQVKMADSGASLAGIQQNIEEKREALQDGDYVRASGIDHDNLSAFAYNFFGDKHGMDHLEGILKIEAAEASQRAAVDPDFKLPVDETGKEIPITEQLSRNLETVKQLKKAYNAIDQRYAGFTDLNIDRKDPEQVKSAQEYTNYLKWAQYKEASDQLYIKDRQGRTNRQLAQLNVKLELDVDNTKPIENPSNPDEQEYNTLLEQKDQFDGMMDWSKTNYKKLIDREEIKKGFQDYLDQKQQVAKDAEVKKAVDTGGVQQAEVVTPVTPVEEAPAQVPAPAAPEFTTQAAQNDVKPAAVQPTTKTEAQQKQGVKDFLFAFRDNNHDAINRLRGEIPTYSKDTALKIANALLAQKAFAPVREDIIKEMETIFGKDFFGQGAPIQQNTISAEPATPSTIETPAASLTIEEPIKREQPITDLKKADIEKRRQEELDRKLNSEQDYINLAKEYDIPYKKVPNAMLGTDEGNKTHKDLVDEVEKKINTKYDAELAALTAPLQSNQASNEVSNQAEKTPLEVAKDLITKRLAEDTNNEFYALEALREAPDDATLNNYLKNIAEQYQDPISKKVTIDTYGEELAKQASDMFPGESQPLEIKEEEPQPAIQPPIQTFEPQPLNELPPPPDEAGSFIRSVSGPIGTNPITIMIDEARKAGRFVFDGINPKEIEMSAGHPKEQDERIVLKTASDAMLLKHHYVMEKLDKILSSDDKEAIDNFKIKLEILSEDNKDFFYQRDEKSNSIIAMIVDKNGKYHYLDDYGNVANQDTGKPFGFEYEDVMYTSEKLGMSRNALANKGIGTAITPNFGKTEAPLMTIVTLLHNNMKVYGSINGVTSGTLSTFNNNNSFNNQQKSSYKSRTVKELFDKGEIEEQFFDTKIEGFYIDYADTVSDQRIKIGRPTLYDVQSGLYIPLNGNKLRDVTFYGDKIGKESQLYEIIDTLDKKGSISSATLRPDKTRIMANVEGIPAIYQFLRELLYSKNFSFILAGDTITLKRNDESPKANSLWDAEINYVVKKDIQTSFIDIPFSSPTTPEGKTAETNISYFDFLNENFSTGAAKAIITNSDVRFTKLNKRIIFQLDQSHEQMLDTIGKKVQKAEKSTISPVAGDLFSPEKDLTKKYTVLTNEDGDITMKENGEEEKTVTVKEDILLKKWVKIEKIEKPAEIISTTQQKDAVSKTRSLTNVGKREKSTYSVTSLIRPLQPKKEGGQTESTVAGNVIDYIAKNIFSDNRISPTDNITIANTTGKLESYFESDLHYNKIVDTITRIKQNLEKDGSVFVTGVRLKDQESDVAGEIDLLKISPDGEATVIDFKTSTQNFDRNHLDSDYGTGVTDEQYFATQNYIYGLMLAKETGMKVSPQSMVIGLPISFSKGTGPFDVKINQIRDKHIEDYPIGLSNGRIADSYKKDGKAMTSVKEIVAEYNKIVNENATTKDEAEEATGKRKRGGSTPLAMTIADVNLAAATNAELREAVDWMRERLGGDFPVTFSNVMNRYSYAEWTKNGTTLYENAIKDTPFHEGFHQFSQLFLTPAEKIATYDSIRKQSIPYTDRKGNELNTSDHTDLEVEEFLADEWVKYAQSQLNKNPYTFPGKSRGIIGFFKNLWQILKNWWSGAKNPTTLFKDLYNGNLKNYKKDINNSVWGNLNSSITDDMGRELLSHARTQAYIQNTSYLVGKILKDNRLSFSWLRENIKNDRIKDFLYDEYVNLQADLLKQLSTTGLDEVLSDSDKVLARTVAEKNMKAENVAKVISQIKEMEPILADDNGAFNNFYDYYIRNSDIDTIREVSDRSDEVYNPFNNDDIRGIEEEYAQEEDETNVPVGEEDGEGSKGERYDRAPNEESAFARASLEVKDFFRVKPIVVSINEDGTYKYMENEFGLPHTYEYASIFNKTKTLLAGKFTIEKMMQKLSNPYIQKAFPTSKLIMEDLQNYLDRPTPENFAFIQKFVKVMALPEIDNRKLTVNFDALNDMVSDREKTVVKIRSMSRTGEMSDINQWQYNFERPADDRVAGKVDEKISLNHVFYSKDVSNILYNIEGSIRMNPFYDYSLLYKGMNTKEFLTMMGIRLNEQFWGDPLSKLADRLKSLLIKDLILYKEYSEYQLAVSLGESIEQMKEIAKNDDPNQEGVQELVNALFISNAVQQFRERRTYKMADKLLETVSTHPAMEDVSRQNSIYSLDSASRSFTDGGGKLKWPFYEPSVIAYRTQQINDVDNVREFNDNPEFTSLNPNVAPWLKNTLFYQKMFDDRGDRRVISGDVKGQNEENIANEKVRIQIADLSSYETISAFRYNRAHPKSLSDLDKFFFDNLTLLGDGFIEIPRAATSSSIMAVKLNSYGALRQGTEFITQYLPLDVKSSSVVRSEKFRVIMANYLTGELQKMKWYYNQNPSNEFANKLNVFRDILSEDLSKKLIEGTQALAPNGNIRDLVKDNLEDFHTDLDKYFSSYIKELYNGKGISYMSLSPSQKKVIKSMLNLYSDKSKSTSKEDVAREREISSELQKVEGTSSYKTARESAFEGMDSSLAIVASTFAVNQFILNIEYHNWYMGDNYLFSNPFKRGNLTTNTGTMAIVSPFTNSILNDMSRERMHSIYTGNIAPKDYRYLKTIILKDAIVKSRYHDMMINDIINWEKQFNPGLDAGKRKAELEDGFKAYQEVNAADGQAKIGLDAYRAMRIVYGNWDTNKDEKEYRRQLAFIRLKKDLYVGEDGNSLKGDEKEAAKSRDKELTANPAFSQFNPQKFSYTGPRVTKDKAGNDISTPMQTIFDKMSLHPLLPEVLAGSGLPDEALMDEMAINDVDYAKFESATKGVKANQPVSFFDGDGNAVPNLTLEESDSDYLLSSYLKHQLSTDGMKVDNTFGSQQRVMFFDVLYQPEVQNNPKLLAHLSSLQDRYISSVENIMGFQRAQFLNRFGMWQDGEGQGASLRIGDMSRFAAGVNSLAKTNNFPSNVMDYLKYDATNQKYMYDPSLLFARRMLIDSIGGLIDSDLRRLKTKGTAAIQVTQVGNASTKFTNPTDDQVRKFGTAGLHYYHFKYNDKGEPIRTSTMGIKITLQGDFRNLLGLKHDGKAITTLEKLNEALKDDDFRARNIDKLTFVGYRIPTNNNNFIDHVEIMEFLPESAGNIIIAPLEHIIKSGSDFDVDKLNFIFPSIGNNGKLAELPEKSIEKIYQEINMITSSVKDYKKAQKEIRNEVKRERRDYKRILKKRGQIEALIRNGYFNIDPAAYAGQQAAGKTFQEITDYFQPFLSDYEDLQHHLDNYNTLNNVLSQDHQNTTKVDHEFDDLFKQLTTYKDYHTNEMLKAMKETLSDPAYFKIMVTPSNASYMLSQAERISNLTGRKTNDGLSSTANTKYTTVNAKHKEYLSDSKDIGTYSIQRIWFSFLNFSKFELNRSWAYGSKSESMRIFTPLADVNERDQIGTDANIYMYGDNLDGISPKDLWDQLMTLTLDLPSNTSYTLLGINKHNRKVMQYLMTSRYSVPKIISFINQPILQEVYDTFNSKSKEYTGYMLKHAMLEVAKRYGIKNEGFEDMYDNIYTKDPDTGIFLDPNVYVENPGIYANRALNEDTHFDQKDLDDDISNPVKTPEWKERQKQALLYFMTANLEASNFTGMQFAFSEDRNKNTNYFTILENERRKEAIRGDETNNLPVDNSMFSKEALSKIEKESIYAPFNYRNIAKLFYEEFAKEFTSPYVATSLMRLLNNTNAWGIDRQMLATRMEGDFVEMIYKNFGTFNIDIYDPFSDTLSSSKDKFSMHFIKNIFNTAKDEDFKGYGSKLIKFLQRYPELDGISFVQKLYPEGILARTTRDDRVLNDMDTFNASVLRFRRSQDNTIAERNHYANELENLIAFNPAEFKLTRNYTQEDIKKISSFFTELAYLTLYQSGPTNIADNFSDLLPANMWQEFSSKAFQNYHKTIETGGVRNYDMMKLFNMMYTENNPKVSWKTDKMVYDLKYYGETLTSKIDRKNAYQSRGDTEYFLNFRAGKMYDLQLFASKIKYNGITDLIC